MLIITAQCTLVQSAVLRSHVVCLSVCDVGGLWSHNVAWKSWKLIIRSISPTANTFALCSQKAIHLLPGGHGEFWGDWRWGREKVACWRTKAAISLKRAKIEEKLLRTAYRKSPTLFRTVPSPTTYDFPFLEIGGLQLSYPLLSQEQLKLRTSNLASTFTGPIRIKAH